MTRLLIRSGKDPFTPVVAESTLTQDVFNSNSGNYLFQHSVWKALAVDGAELTSNGTLSERMPPEPGDETRINEEFDHFVIPLANAFRPEFASRLDRLSELLEGVTIPVTVVGIGAQAAHGQGVESLAPIADTVRTLRRAGARPFGLDRRTRRVHQVLPRQPRLPRRFDRHHRLPVTVPPWPRLLRHQEGRRDHRRQPACAQPHP